MLGVIGKKLGMIRIFDKYGKSIPITLIYVFYNHLYKIKKNFIKIFCLLKNNIKKFNYFFFSKNFLDSNKLIRDLKISSFDYKRFSHKSILPLNIFFINQLVSVNAFSKGKGFSGVIKRHNFSSGRASHGASKSHNLPGSIGMCQDPGRVFLGKKMAGRLGGKKITVKNLKIIKIDFIYNVIFIKGCIPGSVNNYIYIFNN